MPLLQCLALLEQSTRMGRECMVATCAQVGEAAVAGCQVAVPPFVPSPQAQGRSTPPHHHHCHPPARRCFWGARRGWWHCRTAAWMIPVDITHDRETCEQERWSFRLCLNAWDAYWCLRCITYATCSGFCIHSTPGEASYETSA